MVTFTTGFTILVRRKLGLRDLQLATENTAGNTIDVIRLVRMILVFTFSSELIGAGLLSIRFIGDYGPLRGIWISVFEAVSAYCNAGFDILGFRWKDGSMTGYADDPLVCLTIAGLIILGGLGFIVINDIYIKKIQPRLKKETRGHLNLHSSIVLKMTLFLLVLGTVLFFVLEYDNTLQGHSFFEKLNISFVSNLGTNAGVMAMHGLGYPISVEGAPRYWREDLLVQKKLHPEIKASTVIAWRRNIPYAKPVRLFIDEINAFKA